ncbi:helix-turn-helix transcriptional regulator [Candidatus Oleimmundimicrobium sp.]|uniref:helix-turn-helix domain-containing protein n=1 Tax=Candidatus Oleimmundimicrobium sp. TaxID=3060597 RepID=UPI00271FB71C|nr:helix-turn-helix transcriptional regulator [Candidatus Oleimmundimicrobium sp.]MDO8885826.1 helix-turn-helix transcriptional regulator [Candidatus Oleimmundimicrobium sp.]
MREISLINRRLKEARGSMGMTQEEVAQALGIRRPAVAEIEGGKRKVSSIELVAFADLFGLDISFFVAEELPERLPVNMLARKESALLGSVDKIAIAKFKKLQENYKMLKDVAKRG